MAANPTEYLLHYAFIQLRDIHIGAIGENKALMHLYFDNLLAEVNSYIPLHNITESERTLYNEVIALANKKKANIESVREAYEQRFSVLAQIQFDAHMDILVRKHNQMMKKSAVNPNYAEAANKLQKLIDNLIEARTLFICSLDKSVQKAKSGLKTASILAVQEVKETLGHHRKWQGRLSRFILSILDYLTLRLMSSQLTFFGKTDSIKQVDKLVHEVNNSL